MAIQNTTTIPTERHRQLWRLAMSDKTQRGSCVGACVDEVSMRGAYTEAEREFVAEELTARGWDGKGRMALSLGEIQAELARLAEEYERRNPPDDCACGCEGDIESHRD